MSHINKRVPKRRFEEFNNADAWEQRKFIEIINRLSKTSNSSILPKVEYEDIIAEEGRLNKDISNKFDSRKGILFQPKNILYGKLRPYLKNWLYPDFKGVAVGDFWVFEAIEATPRFIYNLIQSDSYQKVANDTAGTKMPRSDWTKVSNSSFFIPKESSEQKRIGTFFKQLDHTITLHQRKLEKVKALKAAYLSEMFPAKGETKPKRRFVGFTNAWEQSKLGELADIIGGGTPSTSNFKFWDGDIDWYSPAEIGNQNYLFGSKKKITQEGLEKSSARIHPIGTVLFTSRAGIGNTAILGRPGATNQGFQSILPKKNILDSYFIFSRTPELKKYGEASGAGSTFVEVSGKQMARMPILMPTFYEQQKIGSFFKQLDKTITIHQRKLQKLQNIKKAYLNEMFI
ncbi:restriction endonuclease subunit S [Listeria monocytogenes]|nr:restriction endonuclease subunit S [Listeria monocytogenes]EHU6444313.1 restriction endonuclease subunit S [Listeria monocytogenes]